MRNKPGKPAFHTGQKLIFYSNFGDRVYDMKITNVGSSDLILDSIFRVEKQLAYAMIEQGKMRIYMD